MDGCSSWSTYEEKRDDTEDRSAMQRISSSVTDALCDMCLRDHMPLSSSTASLLAEVRIEQQGMKERRRQ